MISGIELWWITGILAVVAKSAYQSWQKLLTKEFKSIQLSQTAMLVSTGIFLIIASILRPELPTLREVLLAVLSGVLIGIGLLSFTKSMESTDLSIASPLQQTIPVFSSIIEPIVLSKLGYSIEIIAAAVITTIGAYVVVIKPSNILLPIKRLRDKGPALAILTAVLFGLASIISHYATQTMPVIYYLCIEVGGGFVTLTLIRRSLPEYNRKLLLYGSTYATNLGLSILTLSLVIASKATVFFRLSLILNVAVGVFLFGEENVIIRIIGSIIIILGVALTVV